MSKKRKVLITLGIIAFLMIITNPSPTAFKNYLGSSTYEGLQRKYNFLLFSIYNERDYGLSYLGILGNFFSMKDDQLGSSTSSVDSTKMDTTKMSAPAMMDTAK